MYELVVLHMAARQLKKFDDHIRTRIVYTLEKIAESPRKGEILKGDLIAIYSWHVKIKSIDYRIAYQIKEQEQIIFVMLIGTRENFYDELKKRLR